MVSCMKIRRTQRRSVCIERYGIVKLLCVSSDFKFLFFSNELYIWFFILYIFFARQIRVYASLDEKWHAIVTIKLGKFMWLCGHRLGSIVIKHLAVKPEDPGSNRSRDM